MPCADEPACYPESFSPALVRHCQASFISPRLCRDVAAVLPSCPRYVRLHPQLVRAWRRGTDASGGGGTDMALARRLADALGWEHGTVTPVEWLPLCCFALPRHVSLSGLPLYEAGALIAMDVSSMAAVAALRPRIGDSVLDLCCSPGMKLNLMGDAVSPGGLVTGVDISVPRLCIARSQVLKHSRQCAAEATPAVALFAADGRTFRTSAVWGANVLDTNARANVRGSSGLTAKEAHRLKSLLKQPRRDGQSADGPVGTGNSSEPPAPIAVVYASPSWREAKPARLGTFDRVLVDAECSHDGSLAHVDFTQREVVAGKKTSREGECLDNARRMQKMNIHPFAEAGTETAEATEAASGHPPDAGLAQLQLRLLRNGYDQLRVGGTLVYSTCSFSFWQNEFIVDQFLQTVNGGDGPADAEAVPCEPFSFDHEDVEEAGATTARRPLAACMDGVREEQLAALRSRLDKTHNAYDVVGRGSRAVGRTDPLRLGARFYPHEFLTSFQFIAKVWKRPRQS